MGCTRCGAKSPLIQNVVHNYSVAAPVQDCPYTVAMLKDFNDKLEWFKSKRLFAQYNILAKTINKYLGVVLTSLNVNNRCMYKEQLDIISDVVDLIVTIQKSYE